MSKSIDEILWDIKCDYERAKREIQILIDEAVKKEREIFINRVKEIMHGYLESHYADAIIKEL